MATRPGSRTPRPRRRTESTMEYTAVVIATPIASERIAKTVKSGVAPSRLRVSLMSLTTRDSVASLVAQGATTFGAPGDRSGAEVPDVVREQDSSVRRSVLQLYAVR